MHLSRWEIAVAVGACGLSLALLPLPAAAFAAILAPLAIVVAVVDLDRLIIPDTANAAIFILGLALVLTEASAGERVAVFGDGLLRAIVTGGALAT